MKKLHEHLVEFKRDGFTLFPKMLDAAWVREMRDAFEEIADRIPTADGSRPSGFVDVLEHKPELVLPALANERLLDFAEMVVGPHVQLESITYRRTAPQTAADGCVLGFHRDMFAFFPEDGVYHRPLLLNALSYLQDLTDENGSMLHSGTVNRSTDYRYLFFLTLNHSWLKHRANYQGPVSQAVIAQARARNDRRLMRLLGVDDQFFRRANCGFLEPDEENWKKWIADDAGARNTS